MSLWWCVFEDHDLPCGPQSLGRAIIMAPSEPQAAGVAALLVGGCSSVSVLIASIPPEHEPLYDGVPRGILISAGDWSRLLSCQIRSINMEGNAIASP